MAAYLCLCMEVADAAEDDVLRWRVVTAPAIVPVGRLTASRYLLEEHVVRLLVSIYIIHSAQARASFFFFFF
jgi:hypothetical protein